MVYADILGKGRIFCKIIPAIGYTDISRINKAGRRVEIGCFDRFYRESEIDIPDHIIGAVCIDRFPELGARTEIGNRIHNLISRIGETEKGEDILQPDHIEFIKGEGEIIIEFLFQCRVSLPYGKRVAVIGYRLQLRCTGLVGATPVVETKVFISSKVII
jgi:hypothetical protein